MKILFIVSISFILFYGCGKKSEPKYEGRIEQQVVIIS